MEVNLTENNPRRNRKDYFRLSRWWWYNHWLTESKKVVTRTPKHQISDFFTRRIWSWLYYYLDSRFGPKHPYNTYDYTENGIYPLINPNTEIKDYVSIAITADWATETSESIGISKTITRQQPDYTIHLGDTYYVGSPDEIRHNFTDKDSPWVRGKAGSFALLGNHEMYARGIAYFRDLLPTLGIRKSATGFSGQQASYFCLENEYWRILGLDTGYNSIGKWPILEWFNPFSADCRFEPKLINWLKTIIDPGNPNNKKGILILTHHQYITAFNGESEYQVPAVQLAELLGTNKPVLWIWGHEHKFSIYGKVQVSNGVTAYGRCIGAGGMPIELNSTSFIKNKKANGYSKLVMVDSRFNEKVENTPLGYNMSAFIKIKNNELCIEYHDTKNKLLSENWVVDDDGNISGSITIPESCPIKPVPGKSWEDAVN